MDFLIKKIRSKKGNKENFPDLERSTLDRSTLSRPDASSSHNASQVYYAPTGKPRHFELNPANPYSVPTAPKTRKGPRSCPGGIDDDARGFAANNAWKKPFNDRRSEFNSSLRYENIQRDRLNLASLPETSEYGSGSADPSPTDFHGERRRRDEVAHFGYDESDDDGSDHYLSTIHKLEKRLSKSMSESRRDKLYMDELAKRNRRLEESLKQSYVRYDDKNNKYNQLREFSAKQDAYIRQLKAQLREASKQVFNMELEREREREALYKSHVDSNTSSLDAGEALCTQSDSEFSLSLGLPGMPPHLAPIAPQFVNVANFGANKNDMMRQSQADALDEVRIFRRTEAPAAHEEDSDAGVVENVRDSVLSPNELSVASEPVVVDEVRSRKGIRRSMSDSDLVNTTLQEVVNERSVAVHPQKQLLAADPYIKSSHADFNSSSSDSSDDERMRIVEKQLKKKGGLVKFNPPRASVQQRNYRRYGKPERNALAEFEYLQDLSTDASGIISSPEYQKLTSR